MECKTDLDMNQRMHDLEEKMTSIDTKLTQVIDAILGNPLTKYGGFMNEVETLKKKVIDMESSYEKRILKIENFQKRMIWTGTILIGLGMFIQYLVSIYSNLRK